MGIRTGMRHPALVAWLLKRVEDVLTMHWAPKYRSELKAWRHTQHWVRKEAESRCGAWKGIMGHTSRRGVAGVRDATEDAFRVLGVIDGHCRGITAALSSRAVHGATVHGCLRATPRSLATPWLAHGSFGKLHYWIVIVIELLPPMMQHTTSSRALF